MCNTVKPLTMFFVWRTFNKRQRADDENQQSKHPVLRSVCDKL